MQSIEQPTAIESLILELEKMYPYFKKMDIFTTVRSAYKKIHPFFITQSPALELEKIRESAVADLSV
jgi:hypothetical protein